MVFSSTVFLFLFLPLVFFLNLILPVKYRNGLLLVFSLFFYAWGEPIFVLVMLLSICMNYGFAVTISKRTQPVQKRWLIVSVIANLALLFIFKYTNFFIENINAFFHLSIDVPEIPLPIGISFFTFQAMSYVIDIYRETAKPEHNLFHAALYISFFPQLIAGPIVKYDDIYQQIESRRMHREKVKEGIRRFILGLGKKLIIANIMGEIADAVFALEIHQLNIVLTWVGAIAYCIQIYFDFSGYSDMAIGLGKMFGFDFKENFNYPYIATSINDFWKRWHISLTVWFREYLYIPLGGNRKGKNRTYLNIFIVYLCTGFWHGAEWTFMVWGIFHGIFMILERAKIIRPDNAKHKIFSRVYVLTVVLVGFTLFRAETITQGMHMIGTLFAGFQFDPGWHLWLMDYINPLSILVFAASLIAATPLLRDWAVNLKTSVSTLKVKGLQDIASVALFLLCLMVISTETYNPFIYFRF